MSEDSLSLIIDSLIDLQRLGGSANDEELWSFTNARVVPEKLPKAHDVLEPMLQTARVVLKRLKGVKDALHSLTRSCERRLETLERELTPSFLHGGIQSLPDDVLSYVFRLMVEDDDGSSDLLPEFALSQVCRSFRSLAKETASLWSRLTSRMTKPCLYRHLEWSCLAPLTIVVCEREWSEELGHFIQSVVPHASRWRAFRFRFEELIDNVPDTELPVELAKHLHGQHLPNLETFELAFEPSVSRSPPKSNTFRLYASEHASRLRYISSSQAILASATSIFPLTFVKTFDFTWSIGSFDREDWLVLLLSMKSLIELSVDIKDRQFGPYLRTPSDHDILPCLESLSVCTRCPTSFSLLMQSIRMPSLKKLRIDIDGSQSQRSPEDWIERIPPKKFCSVSELCFSYSTNDCCSLDLSILLEKFPGLEHLELQGSYDALCLGSINTDLPPLQSMSMRLGTRNDQAFVRRFVKALNVSGRWDGFDLFRFKADNFLARDQAEQLLTRSKVQWYE